MTEEYIKSELYYLKSRVNSLEELLVDIVGALSPDAFDEKQLDKVLDKYGEIKRKVESRNEIK